MATVGQPIIHCSDTAMSQNGARPGGKLSVCGASAANGTADQLERRSHQPRSRATTTPSNSSPPKIQ